MAEVLYPAAAGQPAQCHRDRLFAIHSHYVAAYMHIIIICCMKLYYILYAYMHIPHTHIYVYYATVRQSVCISFIHLTMFVLSFDYSKWSLHAMSICVAHALATPATCIRIYTYDAI